MWNLRQVSIVKINRVRLEWEIRFFKINLVSESPCVSFIVVTCGRHIFLSKVLDMGI